MKDKKYNLFGSEWTIKFVPKVLDKQDEHWMFGVSDSYKQEIQISTKFDDGTPVSKDELEITILHEIVHAIFATGQYSQSNSDEPLVEWTARCLYALKKQKIL